MDPSYNNGLNSQTPASQGGAGQGAGAPAGAGGTPLVFSGQSVPNMPSALNAPSAPNMPSAPSVLNAPSAPAVATPIVGGGEDIVLAPEKKTKKKLAATVAVSATILVVALLGCGIWWFLANRNTPKTAFNEYANFLLYGEESSSDIEGEYNWGYRYYARSYDIIASDGYRDYLDALRKKYERFYDEYGEKNKKYDDIFWLFYYTSYYPDIKRGDILNSETKTAEEIALAVRDYYSPFLESTNELVQQYGEQRIKALLGSGGSEYTFPDYDIEIFEKIWELKNAVYD